MAPRAGSTQRVYRCLRAAAACALLLVAACPARSASAEDVQPLQRGFVLTGWNAASYLSPRTDTALKRMADDGASHAAVFTQWFMDSPTSSHLAPDPARTPTDESIVHAIELAKADGMAVTVKPQVGIRTGSWIGYAHPADLDAFWADYRTMLLHYADLAQQAGASMLVVGTEMQTLSRDEARWRTLIAEVRTHFSGQLTYAANYDEFDRMRFWDALDYIGIDAYFGLADDADPAPPVESLAAAWTNRGYVARIRAASERAGRKVLFTEIGYRGTYGTAAHPNIWNGRQVTNTAAQANAYEAFYRAVSGQSWMAGFYWWEVNNDSWWVQDYNPIAKPAEQVMIEWNKRLAPPADPPQTDPDATNPTATDPLATDPPPAPPAPDTPAIEPPATDPAATALPAPATDPGPPAVPPMPPDHPQPAPVHPVIYMAVRAKRLAGAVAPYAPACGGRVNLRVRVKRAGKWSYIKPPAPVRLTKTGAFARRMPGGRLKVRAVYSSSCAKAGSAWVVAHG